MAAQTVECNNPKTVVVVDVSVVSYVPSALCPDETAFGLISSLVPLSPRL